VFIWVFVDLTIIYRHRLLDVYFLVNDRAELMEVGKSSIMKLDLQETCHGSRRRAKFLSLLPPLLPILYISLFPVIVFCLFGVRD